MSNYNILNIQSDINYQKSTHINKINNNTLNDNIGFLIDDINNISNVKGLYKTINNDEFMFYNSPISKGIYTQAFKQNNEILYYYNGTGSLDCKLNHNIATIKGLHNGDRINNIRYNYKNYILNVKNVHNINNNYDISNSSSFSYTQNRTLTSIINNNILYYGCIRDKKFILYIYNINTKNLESKVLYTNISNSLLVKLYNINNSLIIVRGDNIIDKFDYTTKSIIKSLNVTAGINTYNISIYNNYMYIKNGTNSNSITKVDASTLSIIWSKSFNHFVGPFIVNMKGSIEYILISLYANDKKIYVYNSNNTSTPIVSINNDYTSNSYYITGRRTMGIHDEFILLYRSGNHYKIRKVNNNLSIISELDIPNNIINISDLTFFKYKNYVLYNNICVDLLSFRILFTGGSYYINTRTPFTDTYKSRIIDIIYLYDIISDKLYIFNNSGYSNNILYSEYLSLLELQGYSDNFITNNTNYTISDLNFDDF